MEEFLCLMRRKSKYDMTFKDFLDKTGTYKKLGERKKKQIGKKIYEKFFLNSSSNLGQISQIWRKEILKDLMENLSDLFGEIWTNQIIPSFLYRMILQSKMKLAFHNQISSKKGKFFISFEQNFKHEDDYTLENLVTHLKGLGNFQDDVFMLKESIDDFISTMPSNWAHLISDNQDFCYNLSLQCFLENETLKNNLTHTIRIALGEKIIPLNLEYLAWPNTPTDELFIQEELFRNNEFGKEQELKKHVEINTPSRKNIMDDFIKDIYK